MAEGKSPTTKRKERNIERRASEEVEKVDVDMLVIQPAPHTLAFHQEFSDITLLTRHPSGKEVSVPAHSAILWFVPYFKELFEKKPLVSGEPYVIQLGITPYTLMRLLSHVYPVRGEVDKSVYLSPVVDLARYHHTLLELVPFNWKPAEKAVCTRIWSLTNEHTPANLVSYTLAVSLSIYDQDIERIVLGRIDLWRKPPIIGGLKHTSIIALLGFTSIAAHKKLLIAYGWLHHHPSTPREVAQQLLDAASPFGLISASRTEPIFPPLVLADVQPFLSTTSIHVAHHLLHLFAARRIAYPPYCVTIPNK